MTQLISPDSLDQLFPGKSEMSALMRAHDWSSTHLGPVDQWPQSLRTTVSILLSSRYPMFTFWGPQLVKLYNDSYRPILGDKHPAALGQPGPQIWHEIWHDIVPLVNQVIVDGESTWSDNLQLFMHRSSYVEETYFTFSYSPVRDETGGIGGLFCACTETTQQVLGERRLRTLRDLAVRTGEAKTAEAACQIVMQTLASNPEDMPFALLYLLDDDEGQMRLAGITGLAPHAVATPEVIDLNDGAQSELWPVGKVLQTAQTQLVECLNQQWEGLQVGPWSEAPHTALVVPVASPGQVCPTGVLVAGISSRLVLDDDYQGFLELVAGQVASAIADARAYAAERQRAKALATIDQAKTVFFSNVSHEFRTPLTLMLAPIEDALADVDQALPPIQRSRLELVQRNGLRLLKLVNILLDFSRIEAGRMQATYEPTDLAMLTTDLAGSFRSLVERAGLTFMVECVPPDAPVYVDRDMWKKIVLNLLSNAFKYTFAGSIAVGLYPVEGGVELAIADTGIGIPTDDIPHLFERFHQVIGAQGRSFEGSGIGLSLVQELVNLHGGHIEVTSSLSQGSCFTVFIPQGYAHLPIGTVAVYDHSASIEQSQTAANSQPRALGATETGAMSYVQEAWSWLPNESAAVATPTDSPKVRSAYPDLPRIVLADDNADMRDYMQRILGPHYQVEITADGMAALAAIEHNRPDLVLTDVMMPCLDGFGLLRELRANPHTRDLPIILLSARAGEESRIEGLEAGADDYLIKPFSSRELLVRVEAHLKMAQKRQESTVRERALRQQQLAEIETIYQSAPIGLSVLDTNLRFVRINQRLAEMNGIAVEDHIGRTVWELLPDLADAAEQLLHPILATGEPVLNVEITGETPAQPGVQRTWVESFLPLKDGDRIIGISTVCEEITERKRIEANRQQAEDDLRQAKAELETRVAERTAELSQINASLQQSELTLRSFFNSTSMMMGIVELHDGDILHISDNWAAAEFHGTTPAAMANQLASSLGISPDVIQQWIAYYCQSEQEQAPVRFDYRQTHAGQRRWLSGSVCLIASSPTGYPRFSYILEDITERKLAESALQESQEQFQSFMDYSPLVAWITDAKGDLQFVNRSFQDLMQRPEVELLHHNIVDLFPAENAHKQQANNDYVIQTQQVFEGIEYAPRRDDTLGIFLVYKFPIRRAAGQIVAGGMAIDITDRQLAEDQLARSEEQLRLALDFTHIGAWDWNLQTGTVSWSRNHFHLLGLEPAVTDDLYKLWRNAVHPDDLNRVEHTLWMALNQHQDYEAEYRVLHPDGTVHWLVAKGHGIYDEAGAPIRMLGVILDVSDRKQAEHILDLQAVITRNMAEGICLARVSDGVIVYVNPKFEQMFGYDPGELSGQHVSIVNYGAEETMLEEINQAIQATALQQDEVIREVQHVRKDGTLFWCNVTTSVFEHPDYGQVLVAVQQDITERKQTQEQIRASLREKEVLLKEVHHRVKNNLGIVSSLLQMQARRTQNVQAGAILRDSRNRVASIALVHEKLYRSKDLANINFTQYIQDLTTYLFDSYNIGLNQVNLNIQVDELGLDIDMAIPCGLIINELVSNALKYAFPDQRKGEVLVRLYQSFDVNDKEYPERLTLLICDNGVGLPLDFSLEHAKTLGITLVQGLVRQIQGVMKINTLHGTEFEVSFPRNQM